MFTSAWLCLTVSITEDKDHLTLTQHLALSHSDSLSHPTSQPLISAVMTPAVMTPAVMTPAVMTQGTGWESEAQQVYSKCVIIHHNQTDATASEKVWEEVWRRSMSRVQVRVLGAAVQTVRLQGAEGLVSLLRWAGTPQAIQRGEAGCGLGQPAQQRSHATVAHPGVPLQEQLLQVWGGRRDRGGTAGDRVRS